MTHRNVYTTDLDRSDARRGDAEWTAERMREPSARATVVWRDKSLVSDGEPPAAVYLAPGAVAALCRSESVVFLGHGASVPYFGVDVSELEDPLTPLGLDGSARFEDLRRLGPRLPHFDAAVLAYARGMAYWHRRHRHCGVCGAPTSSERAGHLRSCRNPRCATDHFPRTDPAVIVLVTHEDRCLLGRNSRWPAGRYSVLAGFVEPGEDLESTVIREVFEEAGVVIDDVRYHSSQPWPFPSSLMVGFTARAVDPTIRVDSDELAEARWFSRPEVHNAVERGELLLSPVDSISRTLVEDWLASRD